MGDKTCTKCHKTKPLSDFGKRKASPDGLFAFCKLCRNASIRKRNNENPAARETYRNATRKYCKDRPRYYRNQLRSLMKNPKRFMASHAVHFAKQCGELIPEPCEVCGEEKVQAHHDCYKQKNWLNVRWLCSKHHGEHHAQ